MSQHPLPSGGPHARSKPCACAPELLAKVDELEADLRDGHTRQQSRIDASFKRTHELRMLLGGILDAADLLQAHAGFRTDQTEAAHMIRSRGEYLMALIDDMLDLTRLDAGMIALHPDWVDLNRLIHETVAMVSPQSEAKRLALEVSVPHGACLRVRADGGRLRQVLLNLLSNAVKYTSSGFVKLRVNHLPASHDGFARLRFTVMDSGRGMSREQLAGLYLPLQPEKEGEQGHAGHGIGLLVTRKLLRLMGTDLQISSVLENGTIVEFTLQLLLKDPAVGNAKNLTTVARSDRRANAF